jgi:hypothetical protein
LTTPHKAKLISGVILFLIHWNTADAQQTKSPVIGNIYSNATLAFRYTVPSGLRDKTEHFRSQIQEQAGALRMPHTLTVLLAMSSGPDDKDPMWGSLTIETYPRDGIADADDAAAEAKMSAWVAHSKDARALPRSVVISGQKFSVSVFGLQEGNVRKAAVVWTTVRKHTLLSFAFAANGPEQVRQLTESMKTLKFF